MSVPEGWYPDPQQHGWWRYWDGTRWTPHRAPQADPASTADQADQAERAAQAAHQETTGGPGGIASLNAEPTARDGDGPPTPATTAATATATTTGSSDGARPLLVVALVAVSVLVLVTLVAMRLIGGVGSADAGAGPSPATPVTSAPIPTQTPSPSVTAPTSGDLVPGEALVVQVLPDTASAFTLQIEDPGLYQIATRSPAGVDPVLEVSSADGSTWEMDDGGTDSPNSRDAGLQLTLNPGVYSVTVREWSGTEATIDLSVAASEIPVIEPGEHPFEVRGDEVWSRAVTVAADDQVIVDARAADGAGDAMLEVVLPDGTIERNDDRLDGAPDSGNQLDPYVETPVAGDGLVLIRISGYTGEEVSGTVTITVE